MTGLIEALVTLLEFILLGGMATIVLAYAFIWIHPAKDALSDYYKKSKSFLLRKPFDSIAMKTVLISVFGLGYLYFVGSVTNTTGYWLLEPAHNAELGRFYSSFRMVPGCSPTAAGQEIPMKEWLLLQRVLWSRQGGECERRAYEFTLTDDSSWRTLARESASDALDPMHKHMRLARGMALCSLGLAMLAALKFAGALLVLLSTVALKPARFLYKALLNEDASDTITRPHIRKDTYRVIAVYLTTVVIALASYLVCVRSYMGVEREFHGLAYFGSEAAKEKGKQNRQSIEKPANSAQADKR